jgi:hypothetical protein
MPLRFLPIISICTALIVSGCTNTPSLSDPVRGPADCGASVLQDKLGEHVTGNSAENATVGGIPVSSRGDVRVIAPGQAVIQNYSDSRLNLEIDASGNLMRATCG